MQRKVKRIMKIKRIILNNFQKYKQQTFEFSPFFTAIQGESDTGKSTIRRAYTWVIKDLRKKLGYRHWENDNKTVGVTIDFEKDDDIITIGREKNDSKNDWKLNGKIFEKPGSVPAELYELIPNSEVQIGATKIDLCFQHQNEGFFLVDESPITRALYIDELSGVVVANKAIKNIQKDSRSNAKEQEKTTERIDVYREEYNSKSFYVELKDQLDKLIAKFQKLCDEEKYYDSLQKIIAQYQTLSNQLNNLILVEAPPNLSHMRTGLTEIRNTNRLLAQHVNVSNRLNQLKIHKYNELTFDLNTIRSIRNTNQLLLRSKKIQNEIELAQKNLTESKVKLTELKNKFKEIKTCKTCGRPVA